MTPERWHRIKEVLEATLDIAPDARAAFLATACAGDEDLRVQITKLLEQHEHARNFLEHPPLAMPAFAGGATVAPHAFSPEQMVGGRFRIVRALGQGGMGEVYEAFDLELHEAVALKTIKPEMASDPRFIDRFKHEVQRSRTVSHPNVCRVYDLVHERIAGEPDRWFLTMELLRGETLSERIGRDGALARADALRMAKQLCDALDAAHGAGLVHRDFKSANVMLVAAPREEGPRAVVTDFGLARAVATGDAADTSLESLGGALGTPAYMAPEQVEGKPATAASDLYALGIVLYEMVTGTRPFVGDSAMSVAVKRLTTPPVPPRAHVADLEPHWEDTILRCLERDPAKRFISAGDVYRSLELSTPQRMISARPDVPIESAVAPARHAHARWFMGAAAVLLTAVLVLYSFSGRALAEASIAVVPFATDGTDPDTEYLSDGITEAIIDTLAQLPQPAVKVIARNSVVRFKGQQIDAQAIGDELNVRTVVIGRIVQRSETLSVSAELVNADDRSRLWGDTYSASISELPAVQEDIAEKISDRLRLQLNGDQKQRLSKRYAVDVDAYRRYLKGRHFWNQYSEEGWKKAIDQFRQAIDIDPNYALAWSGLADSYYQLSSLVMLPGEAIPLARAAAMKALTIDETVAEAHASLGIIKAQYDWDAEGAEKDFKRAIDLNPSYATAHQWYGMLLFADAQFEAALVEFNTAQDLDPLSLMIGVTAAWPLRHLGRDDEAIRQIEKVTELFPDVPDLQTYLRELRGEVYLHRGMNDAAVAEFLNGYRTKVLCGDDRAVVDALEAAYKTSGLDGYWRKQLELASHHYRQELADAMKQSPRRYLSPFRLAELRARLGDHDGAFELLQVCYTNRDENLRWLKAESLLAGSPWQNLRSDARFAQLLRDLGLAK
jgi:TolB-like protein